MKDISKTNIMEIAIGVLIALVVMELLGMAISKLGNKDSYDEEELYYDADEVV